MVLRPPLTGRAAVAAAYAELGRAGLVTGATGNVSAALDGGLAAVTAGGSRPGDGEEAVALVRVANGETVEGPPPSSELASHLTLLRGGAGAVAHTHAPHATALGLMADQLPLILAEQAIDIGGPTRVLPYVGTGTEAMAVALAAVQATGVRAAIIRNHGAVTWGPTLERALAATYALEEAARVWLLARGAGAEPLRLPPDEADRLRDLA